MEASRPREVVRETVLSLRQGSASTSSSEAYEAIHGLIEASTNVEDVDSVYDFVIRFGTELLLDDYDGLGQLVDLLKRTLLRCNPSLEQLRRTIAWCEVTVKEVSGNGRQKLGASGESDREEGEEEREAQRTQLVNSLKFLRRLVGRHLDARKEEKLSASTPPKSEAEQEVRVGGESKGDGDEPSASRSESDPGAHSWYPHSALGQLRANAENPRRRSSAQDASSQGRRPADRLSLLSSAKAQISGARSEKDQNSLFRDLLEDETKTVRELQANVRLALAHMIDLYEKDSQHTFVVISIFMQEMLLESKVNIQLRAFDIFLNLVYHWQILETRQAHQATLEANSDSQAEAKAREAWILKDAMWHATLLNEMCLVLLDCGPTVSAIVWRSAHACVSFCCTRRGLLVPKLVKLISFEVLHKFLWVSREEPWSAGAEGTIVSMVVSHILPHRGNHLGVDQNSLQILGGERAVVALIASCRSPSSLANLLVLMYYIRMADLNGPALTLSGDHLMNSNLPVLDHLLRACDFTSRGALIDSLQRVAAQERDGTGVVKMILETING